MAAPMPAPFGAPAPVPKPPPKTPGIDLFKKMKGRKKNKRSRGRRGHNPPRRYGLLRNFVAFIPKWMASLQYRLVMMVDGLGHSVLSALVLAELLGLDIMNGMTRRSDFVLARPLGSARRLASLIYDSSLGIFQVLLITPWFLFSFPNNDVMTILRRVAILQSCLGALLHYSSVVRWKTRSCEYRVPPLLILVAYFLLPWTNLCGFLLLLRPGDHLLGTLTTDLLALAALAALRVGLFGRYGRPRVPRKPQPWWMRGIDAVVLGTTLLLLEIVLLRNAWIERRKNWKYVFCALLLLLPLPFWRQLLRFFREERDGVKRRKVPKGDRVTREDVRAEIYGKLRPGVPVEAEIPWDVPEKLRARRVREEASRRHREAAPAVPKLPVLEQASPSRSPLKGSDG